MSFNIYNASAGSGKTFTLVKNLLKILLSSDTIARDRDREKDIEKGEFYFKSILAITFTNKAVEEMKERIIGQLMTFSNKEKAKKDNMFETIAKELKISGDKLTQRSHSLLSNILENYSSLSISTIDGFNHRLIRSFAFDLKINPSFEVSMDVDEILSKAVDNLLKKVGQDQALTQLLERFSQDKIEQDKWWDIEKELVEIAQKTTQESNFKYLDTFKGKTLEDFKKLREKIRQERENSIKEIKKTTQDFFQLMDSAGIKKNGFSNGTIYRLFEKLNKNADEKVNFDTQAVKKLKNQESVYTKQYQREKPENAAFLDQNLQRMKDMLHSLEKNHYDALFFKAIGKWVTPLAVLSSIKNEIEKIKEEENILPISEFNSVINQSISTQPDLYIYERIGERYSHFFIDEFQDTSPLQWSNIQPLIKNRIQSIDRGIKGSLMIVGDAKQSIYRFRGGKAEQFIDLYNEKENPFDIPPEVENLPKNYRSAQSVVEFNNNLYQMIGQSDIFLESTPYAKIYKDSPQQHTKKQKGYVRIEFLNTKQDKQEEQQEEQEQESSKQISYQDQVYGKAVLMAIEKERDRGTKLSDICILTRGNKQGVKMAQILAENGISVISSEALLLKNELRIQFLVSLLSLLADMQNKELKADMLINYARVKKLEDVDEFMHRWMEKKTQDFFEQVNFNTDEFFEQILYKGVTYCIRKFEIAEKSDAYVAEFLNTVLAFSSKKKGSLRDFIEYWKNKENSIAVPSSKTVEAVRVMTIHKSKGLEFEVVIYPYVNDKIASLRKERELWISLDSQKYEGFEWMLTEQLKDLEMVEKESVKKEIEEKQQQQTLDDINVLYVATTRAKRSLYLLVQQENNDDKIDSYSKLIVKMLEKQGLYSKEKTVYEFGDSKEKIEQINENLDQRQYPKDDTWEEQVEMKDKGDRQIKYNIASMASLLWMEKKLPSVEKGNLIHTLLSQIKYKTDVQSVVQKAKDSGMISDLGQKQLKEIFEQIVLDDMIEQYYCQDYDILNEQEFLTQDGKYIRPDRIAIRKGTNSCVIIDYKTGEQNNQYHRQIEQYEQTLRSVGMEVEKKILVYLTNDAIGKVEVV